VRRVFFFAVFLGVGAWGCKSDEATICEKLDECNLLPEGQPTKNDKDGFQVDDCERQVENELGKAERERCAECVTSHSCAEIQDACRTDCNPPY
jgi:hypothetical protein